MANGRPDDHPNIESLAQYVERILDEKELTHLEVEERSRKYSEEGIAHAYIGNIVNGKAWNLSVSKDTDCV